MDIRCLKDFEKRGINTTRDANYIAVSVESREQRQEDQGKNQ